MQKTYLFIVASLLVVFSSETTAQSADQNYIRTRTYTKENKGSYLDVIEYFDGLGRPIQKVQVGISPTSKDLISLCEYDAFGREEKVWLPAAITNSNGSFVNQSTVMGVARTTNTNNGSADASPFSRFVYEASPLNRVLAEYKPGQEWHKTYGTDSKSTATGYKVNDSNNSVLNCILYKAGGTNASPVLSKSGNYTTGELWVTEQKDEDGNTSYEFKNKLEQVVLIRQMQGAVAHDTYYVYNDPGNLCFVLPPRIDNEGISLAKLNELAYQYKYDSRNHCTEKRLPGCDPVYYVYDHADRLIFTQDGEQRKKGIWYFSIPDAFARIVLTGTCSSYSLGNVAVGVTWAGTNNTYRGYNIHNVTLSGTVKVLSANYYDNYEFSGLAGFSSLGYTIPESKYGIHYTGGYKDLLTGTSVSEAGSGSIILYSALYYDNRGRLIQTQATNHLGGTESEYIGYNFSGQPMNKRHIHKATDKNDQAVKQTEEYAYAYDHAGRLTKTTHQLNGGDVITLAENTYDELGRLKSTRKKENERLKSIFDYNVRSWVSAINNTHFVENLTYNYNGNIKTQQWAQGNKTRAYAFSYDGLSRLLAATYSGDGNYSTSYDYDKHGNITRLRRYGNTGTTTYGVVDSLTMNHTGNRLVKTNDSGSVPSLSSSADFRKYAPGIPEEYTYDANGNLKTDRNKGITDITYNSLNLPMSLSIGNTLGQATNTYVYMADGRKLKVKKGSFETDYVGNMIYENGTLKRILVDNGYYENGNYYFYIQDHLGNNRIVADQSGNIVQSTQYYPFGMAFADGNTTSNQPYKYNGKELDGDRGLNWYDYSARQMEPVLGRFTTMDPLAEKYCSWSPYTYCKNNPVNRIDPDGKDDYFSSSGVFLLRDKKKTDFIKVIDARDGTVKITDIDKTTLSNDAIEGVVGHYNSELNKTDGPMPGVNIQAACTSGKNVLMQVKSDHPNTIQVNKSPGDSSGGKVRPLLNTAANMKSTLLHERKHVKQNQEGNKKSPEEKEIEAIETQKEHSTWEGTTEEYKDAVKRYEEKQKETN